MKPRLVLMCGLPGAGKTTLARSLAEEIPAIRLCTDDWHAALKVSFSDEVFHALVRHGQNVIFEKGLWLRSERDKKRREARELGVDIELHYFDVPVDELVSRLERRNAEGTPNAFPVAREEIEEYFTSFEPPDEAELALFAVALVHRSSALGR